MKNLCLYHANCPDGFAAAFVVWMKYGNDFDYVPVKYQEPPPLKEEIQYDKILIVDFSYPIDILLEMEKLCQGLLVIDHHDTCPKDYLNCIFNNEKSGCVLTWEYLFPNEPVPELLLYVQDRDLWTWKMPDSRAVNLGLETVPKYSKEGIPSFPHYSEILTNKEYFDKIKEKGKLLYNYKKQLIDQNASLAWEGLALTYQGVICCEVSIPSLISEVGEELRNQFPEAPFILLYGINNKQTIISLRSAKGDIHLGELCKKYGGGGHKNSAGFKLNGKVIYF